MRNVFLIRAHTYNDLTILGPSESALTALKASLEKEFQLSAVGKLHWLLGIQIGIQPGRITLNQGAYIDKLLARFGMTDCNPVNLPLDVNCQLRRAREGDSLGDLTLYQQIIGSLMYLVTGTRPDLAYTVSRLAQYGSKPTIEHVGAAKRVLRYLKGTRNASLTFQRSLANEWKIDGYSDADYANDRDDRMSYSGYVFMLGQSTICWRSRKQRCVATSTSEAEFLALSTAAKQQMWLQLALRDLG